MSSPPPTSPTGPQIRATTTEQTGIHYSTIYLHTVPGTLKVVCLVRNIYDVWMTWMFILIDWVVRAKIHCLFFFSSILCRCLHSLVFSVYNSVPTVGFQVLNSSAQWRWLLSGLPAFCWFFICSMSFMCLAKFHG